MLTKVFKQKFQENAPVSCKSQNQIYDITKLHFYLYICLISITHIIIHNSLKLKMCKEYATRGKKLNQQLNKSLLQPSPEQPFSKSLQKYVTVGT